MERTDVRGSSVARAIHEALAGVVAGDRAGAILRAALAASGVRELPEDSATLRVVVRALLAQVELVVGPDAAELVSDELEGILRMIARIEALAEGGKARSGTVARDVHRADTARAIAPELVLVVSADPDLGSRLRHLLNGGLLGGGTRVEVASTMAGLRFQLLRARPLRPLVVVDERYAAPEPTIGSALARAQGVVALVLWGDESSADPWAWTEPDRIVRCSVEVELVDLACLLRTSLAKVA